MFTICGFRVSSLARNQFSRFCVIAQAQQLTKLLKTHECACTIVVLSDADSDAHLNQNFINEVNVV